jgi:hypothetical protein
VPSDLQRDDNSHGTEYASAFNEAYAQRLRERRGKAALIGGAIGTVAGLGFLIHFLSNLD